MRLRTSGNIKHCPIGFNIQGWGWHICTHSHMYVRFRNHIRSFQYANFFNLLNSFTLQRKSKLVLIAIQWSTPIPAPYWHQNLHRSRIGNQSLICHRPSLSNICMRECFILKWPKTRPRLGHCGVTKKKNNYLEAFPQGIDHLSSRWPATLAVLFHFLTPL